MNSRLIVLGSVLVLFSTLVAGCGAYYVAQSREAVKFGEVAGPAKDWVAACKNELLPTDVRIARATDLWSPVNRKVALEESSFLCKLYAKEKFDIDSVEELVPPYCVVPVCVFVRRKADGWWGMITVQVAKNLERTGPPPSPIYLERNVVAAVQYGPQKRNCNRDLLPELFSQCFWQEPLVTPTPIPTAMPTPTP